MFNDDYEKLAGRISALEIIAVINEIKTLRGASGVEIGEAAKRRAEFWQKIGDLLENDSPEVLSVARTASLERLGKLTLFLAEPVASEIEQMLKDGKSFD
jgi:hypothetical protein